MQPNLDEGKSQIASVMTQPSSSWHPSSDNVAKLYDSHAAQWDRDRGKSLFERGWLDRFSAGVAKGGAILDLGCGAGQPMATYLVERRFRITGIDTSPAMIALCSRRFPGHDWVVGDMRDIRLGRRFAGILAWDSFFHLTPDDQKLALETFAVHSAPSAMLMFTSGPAGGGAGRVVSRRAALSREPRPAGVSRPAGLASLPGPRLRRRGSRLRRPYRVAGAEGVASIGGADCYASPFDGSSQ